jgi:hypothetical protein
MQSPRQRTIEIVNLDDVAALSKLLEELDAADADEEDISDVVVPAFYRAVDESKCNILAYLLKLGHSEFDMNITWYSAVHNNRVNVVMLLCQLGYVPPMYESPDTNKLVIFYIEDVYKFPKIREIFGKYGHLSQDTCDALYLKAVVCNNRRQMRYYTENHGVDIHKVDATGRNRILFTALDDFVFSIGTYRCHELYLAVSRLLALGLSPAGMPEAYMAAMTQYGDRQSLRSVAVDAPL